MGNTYKKKALGLLALLTSSVAIGSTFGPVENFDVVNDTGRTAHGFEIELHDLRQNEITSIFGDASRWPEMERYGVPTVAEYSDPTAIRTQTSTRITYQATYSSGTWSAGTPSGTLPVNPNDSCWPYGAPNYGPDYPCDHFGVSTSVPAASVKYAWLLEDSPGSASLISQEAGVPAPIWTVTPQPPINNQPQPPKVNVVVAAPAPEAYEFGEPRWVKVSATGTLNDISVEDLMAENAVIQKAETQIQVEWQLLQTDKGNPAAGQIDLTGVALDDGATGVVYRFEFYKYTGALDSNHEAKPINGDTSTPAPSDLGAFIVAQMAGVNFDGQVPPLPPLPAAPMLDASISDAVVGVPYSAPITAAPSNVGDVLNFQVVGLPDGLTVDTTTGVISGVATAVGGPYTLNITVTDTNNGLSTSATTSISVVDATITFAPVDQWGITGQPFSYILTAMGGTGLFTYSTQDVMPNGLLLDNATGVISGVPSSEGIFSLTFSAVDSAGFGTSAPINFTISAPAPVVCSGANLIITNGLNIRDQLLDVNGGVRNGGQTLQYSQDTTTIVPPLTSSNFYDAGNLATFSGTNTNGICVTDTLTVTQGLAVAAIENQTLAYGIAITPVPVNVSGGVSPYTIVVSGLPNGLSFNGVNINGVPTVDGLFPVTISVRDSNGQTQIQTVSVTVNPPPALILGATDLPSTGTVGVAYSGSVLASGGVGALTWSANGLPAGVSISASGVISGTPTSAGTYNAILTVTDTLGTTTSVTGAIVISPSAIIEPSCTKPIGATGGLSGKGRITAVNGNVITYKNSAGKLINVTVPRCASIAWRNGLNSFAVMELFQWSGYSSLATGNVAQKVTISK